MRSVIRLLWILVPLFFFAGQAAAQVDEICGETGGTPWMNSSFVYGRVGLNGFDNRKLPKITVVLYDRRGSDMRYNLDRSGNYCFRDTNASGGTLVIEIEGLEITRRSLPNTSSNMPTQHRQDFEIQPTHPDRQRAPGSISIKYPYSRGQKNTDLLDKAGTAELDKEVGKAIKLVQEVVASDPADFFALARLGGLYFMQKDIAQAEKAYLKSIEAKPEYAPAMVSLGQIYLVQKQVEPAVETLEKAVKADPASARGFQLLGEAYLLARKGTLGVAALNEAIRLDPVGMAECHLLMARLYDIAGAKSLASREYRLFLEKMPQHADKKKFERYISAHPE